MSTVRRHLGAGAALSVLVQGGPLLAAGVLSIVLARTIGPSANGDFALLATLTGLTAMVVSLGLTAGITYEVGRGRWAVRGALRASYVAALVLGVLGMIGGLVFFELTRDSVFAGISQGIALVALLSLPAVLAYQYQDAILLGREYYEGYAALELTHAAGILVFGAGLGLIFGLSGAVVGLPAAAFAGAAVGAVLLARLARREPVVDSGDSFVSAVRFGLQSWGSNLLQQINYRFDLLILGGFATAGDVGVYSVALTLTATAWVLPQALQTVVFPRAASLYESASSGGVSTRDANTAVERTIRHGVLLTIPAGLIVAALLLVAVPLLYGPEFHQTIGLGFVLLPAVLVIGVAKILSSIIAGRGRPRYTLYVAAISAPVTLIFYFTLIPAFHAWGAAVGSALSYTVTSVLTLIFFRRATGIGFREAFVPTRHDVGDYRLAARLARERFR
ncbi:MAG TPA: oligosaccharide flippase family protein [Gaiellaceae bacterium]|nr:oligosaccharide flippase family protein [Gaiellaceae bacterium]